MKTKEELIELYVANTKEIKRLNEENHAILKELTTFSEHKVGEIVEWKEEIKKRIDGSIWKVIGEKLNRAVLTRIDPRIWMGYKDDVSFRIGYEFNAVKKDGGISQNHTRPTVGYTWTGEMHADYLKEKADGTEGSH